MKKAITFILAFTVLLICHANIVSAASSQISRHTEDAGAPTELYKNEFIKQCCETYPGTPQPWMYKELYYHHNEAGETDWVLLLASVGNDADCIYKDIVCIGQWAFVFTHGFDDPCQYPFKKGYGIYDLKKNEFYDVADLDADDYHDLTDVFNEVFQGCRYVEDDNGKQWSTPILLGDLDEDNTLTILDAMIIQRCLANMREFPDRDMSSIGEYPMPEEQKYRSDFDRDGKRTILDATAIQRFLVKLPTNNKIGTYER